MTDDPPVVVAGERRAGVLLHTEPGETADGEGVPADTLEIRGVEIHFSHADGDRDGFEVSEVATRERVRRSLGGVKDLVASALLAHGPDDPADDWSAAGFPDDGPAAAETHDGVETPGDARREAREWIEENADPRPGAPLSSVCAGPSGGSDAPGPVVAAEDGMYAVLADGSVARLVVEGPFDTGTVCVRSDPDEGEVEHRYQADGDGMRAICSMEEVDAGAAPEAVLDAVREHASVDADDLADELEGKGPLPDAGVAAACGYVCQNFPEHPGEEVEMESGPFNGVRCPECGRMANGPDDEIPFGDPPGGDGGETRLTGRQFRALLDLFMCADPWPASDEAETVLKSLLLDAEAEARGFDNWVHAFHGFGDETGGGE